MLASLETAAANVRTAIAAASQGLVDRRPLAELIALAAVAREHVLVVGPPGTAKSQAVRRMADQFQGTYFEYLLGRFTEPTDIFGAVDLGKLRQGQVCTQTAGMLPEAEIAFLDEVFLGSTAILNTLLALLNERKFVRGHTRMTCPLRVCVGASNSVPDEPSLEAFADRFLLRVFVEPLQDELLESLLEAGWRVGAAQPAASSLQEIDQLADAAATLDPSPVHASLASAIRALRKVGIVLSDRRIVKTQRLIAAASVLRGSNSPSTQDLWPLVYAIPTLEGQTIGREALRDQLAQSENHALPSAAELASASPAARAARLLEMAGALLDEKSENWEARTEAVLREISAAFTEESKPPKLREVEQRLVTCFQGLRSHGDAPN